MVSPSLKALLKSMGVSISAAASSVIIIATDKKPAKSNFAGDFIVLMVECMRSIISGHVHIIKNREQTLSFLLWWSVRDSNSSPLLCHRSALPNELTPHILSLHVFILA